MIYLSPSGCDWHKNDWNGVFNTEGVYFSLFLLEAEVKRGVWGLLRFCIKILYIEIIVKNRKFPMNTLIMKSANLDYY